MDLAMIEYYHDRGLMPDWIYYQQNGKSAQENLKMQHNKMREQFLAAQRKKEEEAALEKHISELVEKELEKCLDISLNDLFKDFK